LSLNILIYLCSRDKHAGLSIELVFCHWSETNNNLTNKDLR